MTPQLTLLAAICGAMGAQGISYVGSATGTTSATLPTHQAGDLIVAVARRSSAVGGPTIPAGWTVLGSASDTDSGWGVLAVRTAVDSSTVTGTWTNASSLSCSVYRGCDTVTPYGAVVFSPGYAGSGTRNWPALPLTQQNATSWVFGASLTAFGADTTAGMNPPSGMLNRSVAGVNIAAHDTNGRVSSWGAKTTQVAGSDVYSFVGLLELVAPRSASAISYIGGATGTNSATLPGFAVGDVAVAFAFRDGNATAPSLPAGWTNINTGGADTCGHRMGYRVLQSGDTNTGTWTNATSVVVQVYRGVNASTPIGAFNQNNGTNNALGYSALTLNVADGTSWVAGFAGHRSVDTAAEVPPSGMVNRTTTVDATDEAVGHDTAGGVYIFPAYTGPAAGTSSGWRTALVELLV